MPEASDPRWHRLTALLAVAALTGTLAGCGQKGDLYLPDRPVPVEEEDDDEKRDSEA